MTKDLWPDFEDTMLPRSPKAVIEEAGAGLKAKTGGLIHFSASPAQIKAGEVEVTFSFLVPALIYKFPFMRVSFPVAAMYPVSVIAGQSDEALAKDENELIALLSKIFNEPSTILTIQRLMALAK